LGSDPSPADVPSSMWTSRGPERSAVPANCSFPPTSATIDAMSSERFTLIVHARRISVVAASALLAALLPTLSSGASFPRLANPKQIPACTSALLSHHRFTEKNVKSCLSMSGKSAVSESCPRGGRGYLIGLGGWQGVPLDAVATWVFREGSPARRLTTPEYNPRQLNATMCG
jgi:hypothetical protein